jgi:Tol biopolymer transport system component
MEERRAVRKVGRRLLLIGLLALAAAPVSVAGAKTRIVWTRIAAASPRAQIVSARPDGSGLRKLTHPKQHTFDIDASTSPDGERVALERDLNDGETSKVVLVGANGQNAHSLDLGCVDPCVVDLSPTWLNTGARIAFTRIVGPFDAPHGSAHSAALQTALSNGSDVQRLSESGIDGTFEDYYARFSPDGTYLVFTRQRDSDGAVAAFRMDADGSHVRRLTPWGLDADLADLSLAASGPTKDLVVFETYGHGPPPGKSQNIATVPSTCAPVSDCRDRIRYVTHHAGGPNQSFNPSWSPNGGRIAYTHFNDSPCCVGDIWTARPNGGHRRAVSTSPRFEFRPDWGAAPAG